MSWFTKYIEHPALSALQGLASDPAITASPPAAAAVEAAKSAATDAAATVTAAAPIIAAAAATAADPVIAQAETGLQGVVDALLIGTLGPVGAALAVPGANAIMSLLEQRVHKAAADLFAHARAQIAASAAKPA